MNHKLHHGGHSCLPKDKPADRHKSNNFITFHRNIRGLASKTDELLFSLSDTNPQVLCLTEHHLKLDEINNVQCPRRALHPGYTLL